MYRQMRVANTGDWALDLLAAIVQRALLDAQGNGERAEQAARWLDSVWPSWRRLTDTKKRG